MAYTKQNFENGKVLTAEQLNRMDSGIAEAAAQAEAIGEARANGEFNGNHLLILWDSNVDFRDFNGNTPNGAYAHLTLPVSQLIDQNPHVDRVKTGDMIIVATFVIPVVDADASLAYLKQPVDVKGADGKTPEKGTDYWTAEDRAAMVSDVLAALPTWTGGSY